MHDIATFSCIGADVGLDTTKIWFCCARRKNREKSRRDEVYARKLLQRWALKSQLSHEGHKSMRGVGVRESERRY